MRSTPPPLKGKQGTLHPKTKPTPRQMEKAYYPKSRYKENKPTRNPCSKAPKQNSSQKPISPSRSMVPPPTHLGTRMTRVTPKIPVRRGKLNFINQMLYIHRPTREHQIITSRPEGPHHRVSDQQKTRHNTPSQKTHNTPQKQKQLINHQE